MTQQGTTRRRRPPRQVQDSYRHVDEDGWMRLTIAGVPWRISVRIEEAYGLPQITSLCLERHTGSEFGLKSDGQWAWVEHPDDAVITAAALRALPLSMIRSIAVKELDGGSIDDVAAVWKTQAAKQQGRRLPDDHYEAVAEVYKAALSTGAPLKAVQEHWDVSRAMAARYVREARERKLLGVPAKRGLPGDQPKKARKR